MARQRWQETQGIGNCHHRQGMPSARQGTQGRKASACHHRQLPSAIATGIGMPSASAGQGIIIGIGMPSRHHRQQQDGRTQHSGAV